MDTLEQAVEFIRHNETPYWWVKSGNSKIADNTKEGDINVSVELFRKAAQFFPAGSYKLECSSKPQDRSGSYHFPFTKGSASVQSSTSMQPVTSTNPYGIPDIILQKIQAETRQQLLVEQMHSEFTAFIKEWPEFKKKIEKIEKFLADDDGDGTPDLLEMAKKGSDVLKNATEIKSLWQGATRL